MAEQDDKGPGRLLEVKELADSIERRVAQFAERYVAMPSLTADCEVMDIGQLRDMMGLRVMADGDAWDVAERLLMQHGMHMQMMGSTRVMFLKERDTFVPLTGWQEANEV